MFEEIKINLTEILITMKYQHLEATAIILCTLSIFSCNNSNANELLIQQQVKIDSLNNIVSDLRV